MLRLDAAARVRLESAPAKVNLSLHVTGRRDDGYHELDSLVAFAATEDGDTVEVVFGEPGPEGPGLSVDGPFAADVPVGEDNIVVAAARAVGGIAAIRLTKGLPVAAGIGGGSADAAAVLRAAASERGIDPSVLAPAALALGADVPVCLSGRACRMAGIGERLEPVALPAVPALLVNPGVPVATRAVFARLERRDNAPMPPIPPLATVSDLAGFLSGLRNDLEAPARAVAPPVGEAIAALAARPGCLLARMSGSGATVFGLFADDAAREAAVAALLHDRAHWWVRRATLSAGGPGR